MALVTVPASNDFPSYEFIIDLDDLLFKFIFHFNFRMNLWVIDIKKEDDTPVLLGTPLIADWPLTGRFQIEALPPGELMAVCLESIVSDPRRKDLGVNNILTYIEEGTEESEIEEIAVG